ncbi:MAG: undecaprenyldiphospho-muramoylpentapeptide beta-N-acetylglucosaminyltransferase [Armatimonadota bacterium]
MNLRIVLTGGGTGGHAYPALSIADALKTEYSGCEILYIGGNGSIEEKLARSAGLPFKGLTTRKMKKTFSVDSLITMSALVSGFGKARKILSQFKPDLVIGTGGYASAAVVIAHSLSGGKTLIHEQNAVPGRTNLWLSRFASRICVTFSNAVKYFPADKTLLTGLPIRPELHDMPSKVDAREILGLAPDMFTLFVYGGSQGAMKFNQTIKDSLPVLREMPLQIIHQTGEQNFKDADDACKSAGWANYHVFSYLNDVRNAFASTDLMLSRCGASTIAEITALGIPAILVPYPYAYANHQFFNGEFVSKNGGGILIEESSFTSELFIKTLENAISNPSYIEDMGKASKSLGKPHAAKQIAAIAADIARCSKA